MVGNYLKIGFRNIWRTRFHSFINISGLALGIAVTLLIGIYVASETSVNKDIKDVERVYMLHSKWTPENMGAFYTTLGPLAAALQEQFPHLVEGVYRYTIVSSLISAREGEVFKEQIQVGDSSFIGMFGFQLLHGKEEHAFKNNGVVITESVARKYFDRTNALGEVLTLQTNEGKQIECLVTGVLRSMARNSVVNFSNNPSSTEIFLSMGNLKHFMEGADKDWWFKYMISIVKLQQGVTPSALEESLKHLVATNAPPEYKNNLTCELKPLQGYYLEWGDGKMRKMVSSLSAVAIFVLLLVISNFVSIMISTSSHRLREIGLRKLFGGAKSYLILQFLVESIIVSFLATVLSLIVYLLLRPFFEGLLDKALPPIQDFDQSVYFALLGLSTLVGLLAGIYPAIRFSRLKIVHAVRGKLNAFGEGKNTRKLLLGFQITIASLVIICTIVIAQQLQLIRDFDLGYDKYGIVVLTSVPRDWSAEGINKLEAVRTELIRVKGVEQVSISYEVPDGNAGNSYNFRANQREVAMPLLKTDEYFAETYGLNLIGGKFFHSLESVYDSNRVVVNLKAVESFGWTAQSALGQKIVYDENEKPLTIVGVIENFHFSSLFHGVAPVALIHIRDRSIYRYLSVRTAGLEHQQTISALKDKWKALYPQAPFDYVFMEEKVNQFYAVETRLYQSTKMASALTLVITICGMIAFMSVTLARRVKEIGIRRVHGATKTDILIMLLRTFLWEYVIAGVLSCALAAYFLTNWLDNFQYRVSLSAFTFIGVQLAVFILISLFTALYSLRTIAANPVETLRAE
jgi:putative ABC transport system permease protein